MAFRPRNTNVPRSLVSESKPWASEAGQSKNKQQDRAASCCADKENAPPGFSFGGRLNELSTEFKDTHLMLSDSKKLAPQTLSVGGSGDCPNPPILEPQEPMSFFQPKELSQSKIPFSEQLQDSKLFLLGPHAMPIPKTGIASRVEKPVSFAHALRANLPPPVPESLLQYPSYALKAEPTGSLLYSFIPDGLRSTADFGRVIRDAAKTGSPRAGAEESERILRKMILDFENKMSSFRPDGACFNTVIHAYAEIGDALAAENILMLMHQDYERGNKHAEPNAKVYTNILHAWRKSKSSEAPERCEKILRTMNRLSDTGALPHCKPDAFSYTVAFHCWAESNRNEAAERADLLFSEMESRYLAGEIELRPDAILYSNVINIFTKNAPTHHRAEDLLWKMVNDYLTGNTRAEPKIRNFNTIMAMWSKSKEEIAPYKAQTIVLRMLELCKENILNVAPDSYTYCLLLKTWSSSKHPEGVSQAVKCLNWMKDQYRDGDVAACPDVIKYTTCISALAKNGHTERAESLLRMMCEDFLGGNHRAKPNSKLFEIVLNSWTGEYGRDPDPYKAEGLLRHMWDLHFSQKFRSIHPRSVTYCRIIMSMASKNDPERAENLLFEMDQLFHDQKLKEAPTLELLESVAKSWSDSTHDDRHLHIQLLHKLRRERFATS